MRFLTSIAFMEEELIPAIEVDPNSVTPGVIGFVVTFAVMIAVVLLVLDMVRRVRRVRYRSEIAEKLDGATPPAEG
jgi:preprotein translocase subunit Sec61beta